MMAIQTKLRRLIDRQVLKSQWARASAFRNRSLNGRLGSRFLCVGFCDGERVIDSKPSIKKQAKNENDRRSIKLV